MAPKTPKAPTITPRNILPGDIVEVSYLHFPTAALRDVARRLFAGRVTLVQPLEVNNITMEMKAIILVKDVSNYREIWIEQRSTNLRAAVVVAPEGVNEPRLPRVKLLKRPR